MGTKCFVKTTKKSYNLMFIETSNKDYENDLYIEIDQYVHNSLLVLNNPYLIDLFNLEIDSRLHNRFYCFNFNGKRTLFSLHYNKCIYNILDELFLNVIILNENNFNKMKVLL